MTRKTFNAPTVGASGPYSHVVDAGDYVYFSGQTAMNRNDVTEKPGYAEQMDIAIENLFDAMAEVGVKETEIVKVNMFITSMDIFEEINAVYAEKFTAPYPARTCVAVKELPLGADIEIEIVAKRGL